MATELTAFISRLKSFGLTVQSNQRPKALEFISDYPRFIKVLENINNMISLNDAKRQVTDQVKSFIVNYRRTGKPTNKELLHTLIYGPPGCGKTQLGEYLAELWAVSGCLPKDDGVNLFQVQPNSGSAQDSISMLQQILQTDTEKNSLRQNLVVKETQNRHLQDQIKQIRAEVNVVITKFNNARKKVRAKIEAKEPQIQSKFQEVKESLKRLRGEEHVPERIEPEILPVTIPKNPGVRSIFGLSQPPLFPQTPPNALPVLKKNEVKKSSKFIRVTRGDLIAKYQGHSTDNVRKLLNKYIGGVIMIDEAYNLCTGDHDDFGKEILAEIINFMTTWPDKIIFIFAGYRNDMEKTILKVQQGLGRRFNWTFEISGYSSSELALIFRQQLGFPTTEGVVKEIDTLFKENEKKFPHFGGDTQRLCNCIKETVSSQYWEEALNDNVSSEEYNKLFETISMESIKLGYGMYLKNSVKEREEKEKEEKEKEEEEKMKEVRKKFPGLYT